MGYSADTETIVSVIIAKETMDIVARIKNTGLRIDIMEKIQSIK
jgi:hypothetical protein